MNTNRRALTIVGLSTALVLAACSGAPVGPAGTSGAGSTSGAGGPGPTQAPGQRTQPTGGGAAVDACALLTDAEVEEVTGHAVEETTPGPQLGLFQFGCQWLLSQDDAMVPASINLGVMPEGGRSYYDRYFAPFNEEYGYEAIPGVGDEAVDAEVGSILVVAGDAFFNLQYIGFTDDDAAVAAELGRKVVARLGQ